VLNAFCTALRDGQPLVIYGDGTASRDYVHVSDIAAALQLALEHPGIPGGTVLHAASGVETTITALAGLCSRAAGQPDHPVEYRPARPGEVGRNFASYDLARRLLGYSPTVRIEDGIPRLWQWFTTEVFRG
jgi:UDP-glucose 4-epimerase